MDQIIDEIFNSPIYKKRNKLIIKEDQLALQPWQDQRYQLNSLFNKKLSLRKQIPFKKIAKKKQSKRQKYISQKLLQKQILIPNFEKDTKSNILTLPNIINVGKIQKVENDAINQQSQIFNVLKKRTLSLPSIHKKKSPPDILQKYKSRINQSLQSVQAFIMKSKESKKKKSIKDLYIQPFSIQFSPYI